MSTRRDKTRRTPHTIGTKAPEDSSGIQTELAQVLRHLREQPPHKLALDGAFDSASPTHQARIWQKLTTLNVDADALLEMLADDEATQKLVQEVVAAQRLRHWKTIEPHYRKLWNLFDKLCTAPGFLDSGLTVFASTPPRPARGGRVAPGPGFGSRTSPASTARCTSA